MILGTVVQNSGVGPIEVAVETHKGIEISGVSLEHRDGGKFLREQDTVAGKRCKYCQVV